MQIKRTNSEDTYTKKNEVAHISAQGNDNWPENKNKSYRPCQHFICCCHAATSGYLFLVCFVVLFGWGPFFFFYYILWIFCCITQECLTWSNYNTIGFFYHFNCIVHIDFCVGSSNFHGFPTSCWCGAIAPKNHICKGTVHSLKDRMVLII